jgi:2-aminoadipate transaminase
MLGALERDFPADVSWSRPEGGYFLWVDFGSRDATELQARAAGAGVAFVRGADFFPPGVGGARAARFAFSFESPERIDEGVSILASLL